MLRNKRILDYSIVWTINGLEIVLLVLEHRHVFKLEPLIYFIIRFALSLARIALDEDSLKIGCLIRIIVSIDLIWVLNALHFISELSKAFIPKMQGEKISVEVFLRARPVPQLREIDAASVPRFDPKLHSTVRLILDRYALRRTVKLRNFRCDCKAVLLQTDRVVRVVVVLKRLLDRLVLILARQQLEAIRGKTKHDGGHNQPADGTRHASQLGALVRQHEIERLPEVVHSHEETTARVPPMQHD